MKLSGKIVVKGLQLPENLPVKLEAIEIEYDSRYSIQEVSDLLNLIETVPDIVLNVIKKCMKIETEIDSEAKKTVDNIFHTKAE